MDNDIIPVFPTAMAKQVMKAHLKIAQNGHRILKKKADILQIHFQKIGKRIIDLKANMSDVFKEAFFLLAEAKYVSGDFQYVILNKLEAARVRIHSTSENLAGVKLKIFETRVQGADVYDLVGLGKGGGKLKAVKEAYSNIIDLLVELTTLESTFKLLDMVIKSLNRRVNALEQIYIPRIERTIKFIEVEMDEAERHHFGQIKILQNKKLEKKKEKMEKERMELEKAQQLAKKKSWIGTIIHPHQDQNESG